MTTDERNEVLEEAAQMLDDAGRYRTAERVRALKTPTEPKALANWVSQK